MCRKVGFFMDVNKDKIKHIEYLLRKICFEIKMKGREILSSYNITPPQFDALQKIIYNGELTISELSSKLYLAPSTITDLVDRMEKSGLVERVRDTKDRRVVKVKVLPKGNDLLNEVLSKRCEYVESILVDVSEDEKEDFMRYLEIFDSHSTLCK